jgi:hypothetical protein
MIFSSVVMVTLLLMLVDCTRSVRLSRDYFNTFDVESRTKKLRASAT